MNPAKPSPAALLARLRSAFGLTAHPFAMEIPDVFSHPSFDHALERLRYMADRRGTCTLTASPGMGKSTLLRAFLSSLPKTAFHLAYIPETTCAILDLYRSIARAFDVQPAFRKSDLSAQLKMRLGALAERRVCPVLVLDEAHLLGRAFFDELRILTNFAADARQDMLLVLSGHDQLSASLRLGINEALAQRIVLRLSLAPLDRQQANDYLLHRLAAAGRNAPLFTPDAAEALFKASRGVPRRIDRIAELAMLSALARKKPDIDAELVDLAVQEFDA